MTLTTDPALEAVDAEFRRAREAYLAAKARYRVAGEARTRAHRLAELKRSRQAQSLAGLSDAEWAELRQSITDPEPFRADLTLHEPGAE